MTWLRSEARDLMGSEEFSDSRNKYILMQEAAC